MDPPPPPPPPPQDQLQLSALPKDILLKVLYHATMKEGVKTSVLSSEFKNLWKKNRRLQFHVLQSEDSTAAKDFINHALLLWDGTHVLEFKIVFEKFDQILKRDLDVWLNFAKQKGVRDLHVELPVKQEIAIGENVTYPLPYLIHGNLRHLVLIGVNMEDHAHERVSWKQLEYLRIEGKFKPRWVEKLVSLNEKLTEVALQQWGEEVQDFAIKSTSTCFLKLTLDSRGRKIDGSNSGHLVISVPNLESLTLIGSSYNKCLINAPNLKNAHLNLGDRFSNVLGKSLEGMMPKLLSVERISLSAYCVKVLVLMKDSFSFPPLPRVKFLRLYTASTSPREVGGLLHLFQNLEAIHIDWTVGDLWTSFYDYTLPNRDLEDGYRYDYLDAELSLIQSSLQELKVISMDLYFFEVSQQRFLQFVLGNSNALSEVLIVNKSKGVKDSKKMGKVVSRLRDRFPNARIDFKHRYN